jgi:hypothetical protein
MRLGDASILGMKSFSYPLLGWVGLSMPVRGLDIDSVRSKVFYLVFVEVGIKMRSVVVEFYGGLE